MIKEVEGFGGRSIIGYWNEDKNKFIPNYKTFFKNVNMYKKSAGKQISKMQITKQTFCDKYHCFLSFGDMPNQRTIALVGPNLLVYYVLPKTINTKLWLRMKK